MKTLREIMDKPEVTVIQSTSDGMNGFVRLLNRNRNYEDFSLVVSNGLGWNHASIAHPKRDPTWDEMCQLKDICFNEEDVAVQYHPKRSEYVNTHTHCLHLWEPIDKPMPCPPSFMVGLKEGQTAHDAWDEAQDYAEANGYGWGET